jgi:hypothetical protein
MIKVIVWNVDRQELFTKDMKIEEVDAYVALVKKYGARDKDGNDYVFGSVQVDPEGVYIYVDPK